MKVQNGDTETMLQSLERHFGQKQRFHLVRFPDGKADSLWATLEAHDRVVSWFERDPVNVYFTDCEIDADFAGAQPASIHFVSGRRVRIDLDPPDDPAKYKDWRQSIELLLAGDWPKDVPTPTRIVYSGRGFWLYWELDELCYDRETLAGINRWLARKLKHWRADTHYCPTHLTRLVGAVNRKTGEIATVRVDTGQVYPLSAFEIVPDDKPAVTEAFNFTENDVIVIPRDDIDKWALDHDVSARIASIIQLGYDLDVETPTIVDRSQRWFGVAVELFRKGIDPRIIAGFLWSTEYKISDSTHTTKDGKRVPKPWHRLLRRLAEAQVQAAPVPSSAPPNVAQETNSAGSSVATTAAADTPQTIAAEEKYPLISLAPIRREELPTRPWLVEGLLMKDQVSLVAGRGGAGKSLFALMTGTMIASGGEWAYWASRAQAPVRTLVLNAEDDLDETRRRLLAICQEMNIDQAKLEDWLFTIGTGNLALVRRIFEKDGKTSIQLSELHKRVNEIIKEKKIGLLIVDPLVETHEGLDENSNTDMKEVVMTLRRIARMHHIPVLAVHHSRKGTVSDNQDAARGGSAVVNACRIVHMMEPMSEDEAKGFGLEAERTAFVRLTSAKANYAARGGDRWLKLKSIGINNGSAGSGDFSPALCKADLVSSTSDPAKWPRLSEFLEAVRKRVEQRKPPSPNMKAPRGTSIHALLHNFGVARKDTEEFFTALKMDGILEEYNYKTDNRKERTGVRVAGDPVQREIDLEEPAHDDEPVES